MNKINILSRQVAELIAAGEVVERPASVVKEIMENAIDAGASSVTIEIKNGGITFIRITDNGSGIAKDDVANAFKSHATSKISSALDLDAISTLGFRGEALASIAAVAKVDLLTKTADEEHGTRYCIEGGEQVLLDDAGSPKGTTLIIRDLFFNTPARMKFLKKDVSEANAVAGVVDRIALSHPEVAVRFIRDGKQTLLTPGDGELMNAIYSIFGKEFANSLIPAQYALENIKVSGYVSKPLSARPNRSMQFFFLNGRLIKTVTGMTALGEAYKNAIMVGKFPACVLNIEIAPDMVDINVHPSKIEARFVNERQLFNVIHYCAKNAIGTGDTRPNIELTRAAAAQYIHTVEQVQQMSLPVKNENFWVQKPSEGKSVGRINIDINPDDETEALGINIVDSPKEKTFLSAAVSEEEEVYDPSQETVKTLDTKEAQGEEKSIVLEKEHKRLSDLEQETKTPQQPPVNDEPVQLIGEIFNTYIIAQIKDKIIIIDKHAAHERIIYNRLIAEKKEDSQQLLLSPITVTLSKEEYSAVLEHLDIFKQACFEIEDFGQGMLIVRECPMMIEVGDIPNIIIEIAGNLLTNKTNVGLDKLESLYQSIACRAAIKAGDFTSDFEKKRFVEHLLKTPDIRYCPHGRPVYIEMKRSELEKNFGRS
ncbi:MAG: DNA mismatch repair endonuclease MutL [Clostridiales bacterium]|nr:DNA mismatch repair endonuclease MutL [Clostridiales bacterium]